MQTGLELDRCKKQTSALRQSDLKSEWKGRGKRLADMSMAARFQQYFMPSCGVGIEYGKRGEKRA